MIMTSLLSFWGHLDWIHHLHHCSIIYINIYIYTDFGSKPHRIGGWTKSNQIPKILRDFFATVEDGLVTQKRQNKQKYQKGFSVVQVLLGN